MLRSSLQLCSTRRAPIRSQALRCMRWNSALGAATTRPDGPVLSETNRAEATLKRFWKTVGIDKHGDSLAVTLDKRALKTPSGNTLLLPQNKRLVATLIAGEWDSQETMLKPHALPMTSIASRALDAMSDEKTRHDVRDALLNYLDTDTICFHQEEPPLLAELQSEHWVPLLEWARSTFDVEIQTSESILLSEQPEETKRKLGAVLDTFDPWEMAAMERATYTTKSFLIALALVKKQLSIEQAAKAAQIEVDSQIQRWGEVEDSHDVDFHDVRRQLGSAACLLSYT
ncbi:ATP synthase complex assembly protein atp12 [Pleurotus pulmonarius]|nr:ATP synthase complex assembly protein atp12 [Pleurotus pulmonarius]KAF4579144.1 ATP synthase complex assembly protein atp12 [Pleurotus pulmonarius]KAF4603517.1 ATP synthase complex assembly protein atp12 [Pleurotus pulmonarius]